MIMFFISLTYILVGLGAGYWCYIRDDQGPKWSRIGASILIGVFWFPVLIIMHFMEVGDR